MKHNNPYTLVHNTFLNIYLVSFLRDHKLNQIYGLTLEDVEWFPKLFFYARQVSYIDEPYYYYYRKNENSIMSTSAYKINHDLALHFHTLITFLSAHSVPTDIQTILSIYWLWLFYFLMFHYSEGMAVRLNRKERTQILQIFFATSPKIFSGVFS